jgi:hypothetical protein
MLPYSEVAAMFISAMQFSGGVGMTTAVSCLPLIGVDKVECHPVNGPSMTGLHYRSLQCVRN